MCARFSQILRGTTVALALSVAAAGSGLAQHLNGAGATFPNPIYSKWFSEYHNAHPNVEINYQPIGSGGGIRQVTSGTVDFGATDGPMTDQQISEAKVKVQHIPTVLGAVVPIYNFPGAPAELKFAPDVLADIYEGKITNWNDGRIAKDNPGAHLPNQEIIVIHRSDGSGTTFIFTDYLSKISDSWKSSVGASTAVSWPKGLGGKGNESVAALVRQTPGSIGYVERISAMQSHINFGLVRNAAGQWVKASTEGVSAAAASLKTIPADYRVSITNAPGHDAYPISSFTWLLIPTHPADAAKSKVIKDFLEWMLSDGEKEASQLYYAPLPASVATKVKASVDKM